MSLHSRQRSTISRASRNLSEMSVTSKKSTKLINASLEHVHTFGMANTHKGRYDLEKIDNQYDNLLDTKKKISKTTSGKLDPAKPFEDSTISVNITLQKPEPTLSKYKEHKGTNSENIKSPDESPEERKSRGSHKGHSKSVLVGKDGEESKDKLESQTEKQS